MTEKARIASRVVLYLVVALFCIFYLTPLYVTIATALKAPADISLASTWQFPNRPHWQSFADAIRTLGIYFQNNIIRAVTATVLSACTAASPASWWPTWCTVSSDVSCCRFRCRDSSSSASGSLPRSGTSSSGASP